MLSYIKEERTTVFTPSPDRSAGASSLALIYNSTKIDAFFREV